MTISKINEGRARRFARQLGLRVIKSRRAISTDNLGDFMLVDVSRNCVVGGSRFDWTANDVVSYCRELQASEK